jgi:hypothetical protein
MAFERRDIVLVREALHPTEYGARTLLGRGEAVAGLALCFHGPGESESLGIL